MEGSIIFNKKFRFVIKLLTALSFTLFIAYQVILAVKIDTSRIGRLIGIGFYVLLTVASFLAFSDKEGVWIVHSFLMVVGMVLIFASRLINLPTIFGDLDFSVTPSVLNCVAYILSQLATLVLVAGYLALRADLEHRPMMILETILMSVVIVLFVANFVVECILMIKYNVNIDSRLRYSLLSRCLFLFGYVGTAINFVLPADRGNDEKKPGEFYYLDEEKTEIDLVI